LFFIIFSRLLFRFNVLEVVAQLLKYYMYFSKTVVAAKIIKRALLSLVAVSDLQPLLAKITIHLLRYCIKTLSEPEVEWAWFCLRFSVVCYIGD
jgi:hypothetical protein